jgi:hypothetical protein
VIHKLAWKYNKIETGDSIMAKEKYKYYYLKYVFLWGITFLIVALSFISYKISILPMLVSFIIIMVSVILLWSRKLSKNSLYLNNLLNILAANMIAYFVTGYVIKSQDTMLGVIVGVAVMDVFSFTKRGKNTLNAKLAGNINTMARLSICLPIPGYPGLQQIIGVGDLLYYSIITIYYIKSYGMLSGLNAGIFILIGQIVNIIFIEVLKKIQKEQYKGFPATLFPGAVIILAMVIGLI